MRPHWCIPEVIARHVSGSRLFAKWEDDGLPPPVIDECHDCGRLDMSDAEKLCLRPSRRRPPIITHHIIPIRCGGAHANGNILRLCRTCHGRREAQHKRLCAVCDQAHCAVHRYFGGSFASKAHKYA